MRVTILVSLALAFVASSMPIAPKPIFEVGEVELIQGPSIAPTPIFQVGKRGQVAERSISGSSEAGSVGALGGIAGSAASGSDSGGINPRTVNLPGGSQLPGKDTISQGVNQGAAALGDSTPPNITVRTPLRSRTFPRNMPGIGQGQGMISGNIIGVDGITQGGIPASGGAAQGAAGGIGSLTKPSSALTGST